MLEEARIMSLVPLNEGVDFSKLAEHLGQLGERDLIGAVGESFGGLGMSLDEDAIAACGDSGPG
jgi:hypothetical protein